MGKQRNNNITQTGPQGWDDLQDENESQYENGIPPEDDNKLTFKHSPFGDQLTMKQQRRVRQALEAKNGPIRKVSYDELLQYGDFGKSKYDIDESIPLYALDNLEDWRGAQQSAAEKFVHGIVKGGLLAGTTFVDGTLGLLYGVPSMLQKWGEGGSFLEGVSQIWANELSNTLHDFNQKMEEFLPNYRTQTEQENKWWQNVGTANFWADGFLKNLGFTVGAFYSGNAWLKGLKALQWVNSATSAQVVGSLLSGFNEGRVEANNAQHEFISAQNEYLAQERERIAESIKSNPKYTYDEKIQKLKELDENLERQKNNIEQDANKMGLTVLIGNTILLTLDNMLQFGRLYSRGFDGNKGIMQSIASGMQKKGIRGGIEEGGKYIAEEITNPQTWGKGVRNASNEGFEELNQLALSNFAGYWFGGDSSDSYHLALEDPNAKVESRNLINALGRGIADSYGNGENWEEFAIGFLTGAIGMPTFGKENNSSENTWLGRGRSIGISGGVIGEARSSMAESKQNVKDAEEMNKYLDKLRQNANYFAQSQSFTNAMQGFAAKDNKFEFENFSDNDDFAAIARFARRGRLDELKKIVNQDFDNIPDKQLEQIAMHTTPRVKVNEDGTVDYEDSDGNAEKGGWRDTATGNLMSDTPEGRAEMREKLKAKRDKIINEIREYENSLEYVKSITNNSLSDEQVNELAWFDWKINMFQNRYDNILKNRKELILSLSNSLKKYVEENRPTEIPVQKEGESDEHYKKRKKNAQAKIRREKKNPIKIEPIILDNIETVSELLDALGTEESALNFGNLVEANKEIFDAIDPENGYGLIIGSILEKRSGLKNSEYKELIRDIVDTGKIALAAKAFNEKFKEFSENPEKLNSHKESVVQKAKNKIINVINKKNRSIADDITSRFNFDEPPQIIANTIKNNIDDINKIGGIDEWKKGLSEPQRNAVNNALKFVRLNDEVNKIFSNPNDSRTKGRRTSQFMTEFIEHAIKESDYENFIEKAKKMLNTDWLDKLVESKSKDYKEADRIEYVAKLKQSIKDLLYENEERLTRLVKAADNLDKIIDKEQSLTAPAPINGENVTEVKGKGEENLRASEEKPMVAPTEIKIKAPKEIIGSNFNIYGVKDEKLGERKKQFQVNRKSANKKRYNKPHLSEFLLGGHDLQTYHGKINEKDDYIPELTNGYTKAQYKKYINAVYDKLNKSGAFNYVDNLLKPGQEIEFYVDDELSKDSNAGTPIVLMRVAGTDQIIGSMPSEIDFNSIPSGESKTLKEIEPNKYKLYKEIVDNKAVHKTKVKQLFGGNPALSSTNLTLSEIFNGTNEKPILGIVNEKGYITTGKNSIDKDILQGKDKDKGQIYLLIPSSSGKYLPIEVGSLPLTKAFSLYGDNNWYANKIVEKLQEAPKRINNDKGYAKELFKWLMLKGFNVKAVYNDHGKWTTDKSNSLDNATHIQIDYDSDKNEHKTSQIPITNGEIKHEDALNFIKTAISNSESTTTNLNLEEMKMNPDGYLDEISKYLYTNIVKGRTHAINNYFIYEGEDPSENTNKSQILDYKTKPIDNFSSGEEETQDLQQNQKQNDNVDNKNKFGNNIFKKPNNKTNKGKSRFLLVSNSVKGEIATEKQLYNDIETVKRMFPKLNEEGRIVLVDGLIKTVDRNGNPALAYGKFIDGILYISKRAPIGTSFHESFHYIINTLLNDDEINLIFQEAKEKYSSDDEMELEEKLSEDFRDYMNGFQDKSIKGFIKKIFEKLKHIINGIIGNRNNVNNLFYDIYRGYYNNREELLKAGHVTKTNNTRATLNEIESNYNLINEEDNESESQQQNQNDNIDNTFEDDLLDYEYRKTDYSNLDQETRDYLEQRGVSKEKYQNMAAEQRRILLQCL